MGIFERSVEGGWWVEVEGESCEVGDTIGMKYLYVVLENAGKSMGNRRVMALAGGDQVANPEMGLTAGTGSPNVEQLRQHFSGVDVEDGEEVSREESLGYQVEEFTEDQTDAQTLTNAKRVLGQLKRKEIAARAAGRVSVADTLAEEIRASEEWLAKNVGLGGRTRKLKDSAERGRQSVSRAIQRAIAEMDKANPVIADYFKRTIRMGSAGVEYVDPKMEWELSRLVPADIPVRLSERVDRRSFPQVGRSMSRL
jgi:hypothetical protein